MQIRHKQNKRPETGSKRFITKFLYFPLKIKNETRWLEKVTILQMFCSYFNSFGRGNKYSWENITFIDNQNKNEDELVEITEN